MPVRHFGLVEILQPLLVLPELANAVRRQALARCLHLRSKLRIHAEDPGGFGRAVEQVAQ